jgi:hypothetical protein
MKKTAIFLVSTIFIAICSSTVIAKTPKTYPTNGKLKIFILSGQSNMVGFGQLAGSPGTMEATLFIYTFGSCVYRYMTVSNAFGWFLEFLKTEDV